MIKNKNDIKEQIEKLNKKAEKITAAIWKDTIDSARYKKNMEKLREIHKKIEELRR